ncbi:MAG: M6 family metalloprotease domain-containing protein, partial [Thermoplasmata archaeon]|nr:M6 family metalloprotease domain-containing protein [Thermoplasmata archaeon]
VHSSSNSITTLQNRLTGTNSMKSYYEEVSYDNITVDGKAHGWYESSETMAYYGAPEGGSSDSRSFYKLVREAVLAANPTVDFSKYDTNGDRIIDGICLVHAGPDEATTGISDAIWSKQSVYPGTLRVDGVYVGYYFTVSEQSPIGVYVHEFGHMLGLPDLYDTDYSSTGVGVWDVMGSGAWNNWGRTPGHLSAWSKVHLGWVTPTTISNYAEGREIQYVSGSPDVIKIPTTTSREFFLLENRYRAGYDRYLPGDGLLIWHIDNSVIQQYLPYNMVNNNENRKGVDLEEASGTQDLDIRGYNDGDNNDLWKNRLTGFTPDSTPNSRLYDGTDTKIRVFNISAAGTIMTIDIDFGGDSYAVFLDTMTSNMNAAPGETLVYNITVGTRSSVGDTVRLSLIGSHASWGTLEARYTTLVLGPKANNKVQVKVTPPAGTSHGVEGQVILKARSDAAGLIAELEMITLVRQVHLLTVTPDPRTVTVVPGTPKHIDMTITNAGNGLENITLSLDADRGYWGSVTPKRVSIDVLEIAQVRITFSVPKGELAGVEEDFELVLFSEVLIGAEGGSEVTLIPTKQIPITLVVSEVVALRWGPIHTEHVLPGGTIAYELLLFNEGNGDANVTIAYQAPDEWTLEFSDGDNVTIPAFQPITLKANVTAPLGVPAGSFITIEICAANGMEFFYSMIGIDIDQRYQLAVSGQAFKFGDPGEQVEFELTTTNLGNGDDRVSLSILGNGWESEARPNLFQLGTGPVDEVSHITVLMTPPEDARAFEEDTISVIFTSDNGEVTATFAVTLTVNPITSFTVETEIITDTIDPSKPGVNKATYYVHIRNTGNQEDLFHVGLIGLPNGWTSEFVNRMISVPANKQKLLEFSIIPPDGDSPAVAGILSFKVHVASELGTGEPVESPLQVTILANRGHSIRPLQPSYIAPSGSKLTFRVLVVNEGNVPEILTLSAVGEVESYSYEFAEISLEPFGQRVVNLTIRLSSTEEDRSYDLSVIATTKDVTNQASTPVILEVDGVPSTPGPAAVVALLAIAVVTMSFLATARRRRR